MNPLKLFWAWLFFCITPLYFNGSKSKSSTSTENNNYNIDKRQVTDGESVGVSADNSTVSVYKQTTNNMTDLGSIEKAFEFATDAQTTVSRDFGKVLDVITESFDFNKEAARMSSQAQANATDQISKAISTVQDNITGNKYLVTLGMIVAGVVGLAVFGQNLGKLKL